MNRIFPYFEIKAKNLSNIMIMMMMIIIIIMIIRKIILKNE